jgi:hypothetical protein
MQPQGPRTRRPDRSLLRRWAPLAAFLVAAFANRKNKRSAIGFVHERRSRTKLAQTLLTASRSKWPSWSGQFLLVLALLPSMAFVRTPSSASGRSGTRPAWQVSELPDLRTRSWLSRSGRWRGVFARVTVT